MYPKWIRLVTNLLLWVNQIETEKFMPEDQDSNDLIIFEQKQVRRMWHKEDWFYSIIDVVAILTDASRPRIYWYQMKERIKTEGFDEALAQIEQLKFKSPDGRFRFSLTLPIGRHYSVSSNQFHRPAQNHSACGSLG